MPGGKDVLIIVDKKHKFKILILIPSSLIGLTIFLRMVVVNREEGGILLQGGNVLLFDMLEGSNILSGTIGISVYERHS